MSSKPPFCLLFILFAVVTATADSTSQRLQQATSDSHAIEGLWEIESLTVDGKPGPRIVVKMLTFHFDDDRLRITPNDPGEVNYTYQLNPKATPPTFDMTHSDGKHKGETQKGLYALKEDRLILCFAKGGDRPKTLTSEVNSGQILYELKRKSESPPKLQD